MLIDFFRKLGKLKWLPWVAISPFIIVPLIIMIDGEALRGIGILGFFGSMWLGIILGCKIAHFIADHLTVNLLPGDAEDFRKRLAAAFGAFGFLILPSLVGSWTNTHLHTDIVMQSLGAHFLWACIAGCIFFWMKP